MGSPLIPALADKLKRFGYDRRLGPTGSFTYRTGDTPLTVPITGGGMPGFVMVPETRELTPEDIEHEGTHVTLGFPGAVAGKLAGKLLGGSAGAYMDPDELISYMSQSPSAATSTDMSTIESLSKSPSSGPSWYRMLAEMMAQRKKSQAK